MELIVVIRVLVEGQKLTHPYNTHLDKGGFLYMTSGWGVGIESYTGINLYRRNVSISFVLVIPLGIKLYWSEEGFSPLPQTQKKNKNKKN